MAPGMVSHFVTIFCDLRSAVCMFMHEPSRDEERAAGMRVGQGCNQIVKARRFGSGVEGQCNFFFATWAAINLAEPADLFPVGGTTLRAWSRFHMRRVQKRRRAKRKQHTSCEDNCSLRCQRLASAINHVHQSHGCRCVRWPAALTRL